MRNGKHARTCLADGSAAGSGARLRCGTLGAVAVAACEPLTYILVTKPTAQELMSPLKEVAPSNMDCGAGGPWQQEPRECAIAGMRVHAWRMAVVRGLGAIALRDTRCGCRGGVRATYIHIRHRGHRPGADVAVEGGRSIKHDLWCRGSTAARAA